MSDQPTIGRIVHYILAGGTHRPAVVAGSGDMGLSITIFTRPGDRFAGRITQQNTNIADEVIEDQTGKKEGSWHWPERA